MARRFFYVSLGILCLTATYQLGAERAGAEWDGGSPGDIIGGAFAQGGAWIGFTSAGEAWSVTPAVGWIRQFDFDLPVSSSEVKFLDSNGEIFVLITVSDVAWEYVAGVGWFEVGPFPGGVVGLQEALEASTWGRVKGRWRE